VSVRTAAAVSLLILEQKDVEKEILAWLVSPQLWETHRVVTELERVKDRARLRFARAAVAELLKRRGGDTYESQQIRRLLESIPQ
jgi:hypothetical protein